MSGTQRRSVILGTGSELPVKVVTNADLERMVDTSDEWITVRTGIKQRRVLEEGKGDADMAFTPPGVRSTMRNGRQRFERHRHGNLHGGLSYAQLRVRPRRYAGG